MEINGYPLVADDPAVNIFTLWLREWIDLKTVELKILKETEHYWKCPWLKSNEYYTVVVFLPKRRHWSYVWGWDIWTKFKYENIEDAKKLIEWIHNWTWNLIDKEIVF